MIYRATLSIGMAITLASQCFAETCKACSPEIHWWPGHRGHDSVPLPRVDLAESADRNGYPESRVVLGLADELQLTAEQRATLQNLSMRVLAVLLGTRERIFGLECEIDSLLGSQQLTERRLESVLAA